MSDAPDDEASAPPAEAGGCRRLLLKTLVAVLVVLALSALVGFQLFRSRCDELLAKLEADRAELAKPATVETRLAGEPREGNGAALYAAAGTIFYKSQLEFPELEPRDADLVQGPRLDLNAAIKGVLYQRHLARSGAGFESPNLTTDRSPSAWAKSPVRSGPPLDSATKALVKASRRATELMRRSSRCTTHDSDRPGLLRAPFGAHVVAAEHARQARSAEAIAIGVDTLSATLAALHDPREPFNYNVPNFHKACWMLLEALLRSPSAATLDALAGALDKARLPALEGLLLRRAVCVGEQMEKKLASGLFAPPPKPRAFNHHFPRTYRDAINIVRVWTRWRAGLNTVLADLESGKAPAAKDLARLSTLVRQIYDTPDGFSEPDAFALCRVYEEARVRLELLRMVVAAHQAQRKGSLPKPGPAGTVGYGRSVILAQSGEYWIWRVQVRERSMAVVTRFPSKDDK